MRIVVVPYQGFDGAGVLHAHEFANQFVDLGHEVLFLLNGSRETASLLADQPQYELLEVAFQNGLLDREVGERLVEFAPDVIHLWTPRHIPTRVGLEGFQRTDAILVIHYEDDEEYILETINTRALSRDDLGLYRLLSAVQPEPEALHELLATVDREFLRLTLEDPSTWFWIHPFATPVVEQLASGITSIAPSYLRKKKKQTGKPGRVLFPGVDHERFGSAKAPPGLVEELGLVGRTVLLYSGSIAPFHDFMAVLEALPEVVQSDPRVVLVQLGHNHIAEETSRLIEAAQLDDHVRLVGPVPHHSMTNYLALADVFVGCVRDDAFNEHRLPSKVPEYLAVGRPILISSEGIGRELNDGVEVAKVGSDNPREIAAALRGLLKRRADWPRMGERAKAKARELFDWRANAIGVVEFYDELLDRREVAETSLRSVALSPVNLQVPKQAKQGAPSCSPRRRRVLICTESQIGDCMSGVGIRYLEIARILGRRFDLTLAHRGKAGLELDSGRAMTWSEQATDHLLQAALDADVVVTHGYVLEKIPSLRGASKFLVVDLYCPFVFENIEIHRDRSVPLAERESIHHNDLEVLHRQVVAGDYFLCCTERQRDWLLGLLTAWGRISPATTEAGVSGNDFVGLVPFGLPDEALPPGPTIPVLRGVWPGIEADDTILLWGGGLWSWLDPEILIDAMAEVSTVRSDVKLIFLSTQTAEPVIGMPTNANAVEKARRLGLEGRTVFFNHDRYIPYAERSAFFLEADFGVCAHLNSLETRFAFRTRLLDCVHAGLPILTSGGDHWGALVEQENIGQCLPVGGLSSWVQAILEEADNPARRSVYRKQLKELREELRWTRVIEPLAAVIEESGRRWPLSSGGPQSPGMPPPLNESREQDTDGTIPGMEAEILTRLRDLTRRNRELKRIGVESEQLHQQFQRQLHQQLAGSHSDLEAVRSQLGANQSRVERLEQVVADFRDLMARYEQLQHHAGRLEAKIDLIKKIPFLTSLWRRSNSARGPGGSAGE